MSGTSNYSRHVAYTPDGGRVVTTGSNYGNSSFWVTFQDQRERKATIAEKRPTHRRIDADLSRGRRPGFVVGAHAYFRERWA
jgi:hypothetical protein